MKSQMLRWGLSGLAGYLVDIVVLYAAMAAGMGFLRARLLSFGCALIVMWLVSRHISFAGTFGMAAVSRSSLWLEFCRYLAATAPGSFLNLATYWGVLALAASHPAVPAIGVAAGSVVGTAVNFASARWWVFNKQNVLRLLARPAPQLTTSTCLTLALVVFWIGQLHHAALPGLYMDAVNPEYLAAGTLHPELNNMVWVLPTVSMPILGNLYHGMQNFYVGLPVFALLGFNMVALRIAQGLFGSGIIVLVYLVLKRATDSMRLALAGAVGLATELAFLASFRTQTYIVLSGSFWLLWAVYLAFAQAASERPQVAVAVGTAPSGNDRNSAMNPWFWSGVCTGLAVYSYFVFLFFVPAFVILGWWHTRSWRALGIWSLGFVLGMQTYVLGYLSLISALGGLAPAVAWIESVQQSLGLPALELSFIGRLANAWMLLGLALENIGNEWTIFGTASPGRWAGWKTALWTVAVLFVVALNCVKGRAPQRLQTGHQNGLMQYWQVVWLPLVFLAVSLIFGTRLTGHHFTPVLPLMYVILILAVNHIIKSLPFVLPAWLWGGLALGLVLGNLQQQKVFFERLEATGGVGMVSNAINRMADDALSLPPELVHVFPEWGFMMPFAFLTANQRPYELDASPANLRRLATEGKTLRLYYWRAEDGDRYRENLRAEGLDVRASGSYAQRDQGIAFLWVEAAVGGRQE